MSQRAEASSIPTRVIACIAASLLSSAIAADAHAAVLYDNLAADQGGSNSIRSANGMLGDSFSTSGSASTLSDVSVLLSSLSGTIDVSLWASGRNNAPAALLAQLGGITGSSSTAALYTLSISVSLDASSRYWIELTPANGSSDAEWLYGDGPNDIGTLNEYWTTGDGNVNANRYSDPFLMRVEAMPAPEPGIWALMIAGFGMAGSGLRVRQQRSELRYA